jgi:hypothetical protein
MLQARPHAIHFKRIQDFGEGQLVVLSNPSQSVILGHAVAEWATMLDDMILNRKNVNVAVTDANAALLSQGTDIQGQPITEQWTPVGDPNVKIN